MQKSSSVGYVIAAGAKLDIILDRLARGTGFCRVSGIQIVYDTAAKSLGKAL